MDCLKWISLIGIIEIKSPKAEERTVVRSQGIVSIPDRDYRNSSTSDLYYSSIDHSIQILFRVKGFPWLINCELYILILNLSNRSNAKPKSRPPPQPVVKHRHNRYK